VTKTASNVHSRLFVHCNKRTCERIVKRQRDNELIDKTPLFDYVNKMNEDALYLKTCLVINYQLKATIKNFLPYNFQQTMCSTLVL